MGTQFVVQLVNRPGALATFSRALAERGVSIREISGGGAGDHAYAVVTPTTTPRRERSCARSGTRSSPARRSWSRSTTSRAALL